MKPHSSYLFSEAKVIIPFYVPDAAAENISVSFVHVVHFFVRELVTYRIKQSFYCKSVSASSFAVTGGIYLRMRNVGGNLAFHYFIGDITHCYGRFGRAVYFERASVLIHMTLIKLKRVGVIVFCIFIKRREKF